MSGERIFTWRNVLINTGLVLLSGLISLVALEWGVRVLFPTYDPTGMVKFSYNAEGVLLGEKNTVSHQWMKAGDFDVTVRFNRYGLRDTKDLRFSTADDLFVVGDSFSFGHGVEEADRYSNVLQRLTGIPVYNISIPSDFDGYEKLILYAQRRGATIERLILSVCMENDLKQYQLNPSPEPLPSEPSPYYTKVNENAFFRLKIFLGKTSALYNMLISLFHQQPFLQQIAVRLGIMDAYADGVSRSVYAESVLKRSAERLRLIQRRHTLEQMTVLIIPSRALWVGENREVESRVHTEFVSLLEAQGLDVVDLRPHFEANGDPLSYHFAHDGHWNERGHRKAAEVLLAHLSRKNRL
ncbi:hypothetical protein GF339_12150 [candidate division KSB3 bacterium]|uniref:AlgX/AlgJ SGNH hydrolase-like domain-containing protein n=1 Tax=candidate division KSB3 bacterium TaxID=2044937 RepID=A0A9D5Q6K3_9BACT|nr:hypothetical protein [candidate division KSB3 bacterium]MBD3325332.1 hypothetical protein [candidate division KSB3 bacterium]